MSAVALTTIAESAIHIGSDSAPPTSFAAEELQRYLERLTGFRAPVVPLAVLQGRPTLVLGRRPQPHEPQSSLRADECAIAADSSTITFAGGSAGAALRAVYALLEHWGCRWSFHGRSEEVVPRLQQHHLEVPTQVEQPRFTVRGYVTDIMTWHYTEPEHFRSRLADDRAFIDWMAKTGANRFFFIRHPFDTQLTVPELLPDFARRGIEVEYGGHIIPLLLPRELFPEHPEYFPLSPSGDRTDSGNLCTSSAPALATACDNAVEWIRQHRETAVVHIWGADLWKGGWCRCASCCDVGAQDQSLRICNAVAQALVAAGLDRPVCYLAYHDTIDPELRLRPHDQVLVEFAPRERCYGHALDDPTCSTNRRYALALQRYIDWFAGRVRVFEYYGDAILYCGCAVPLSEVIARDLAFYHRVGVREITMLQFGTFSLWAYPFNFHAFASGTMSDAGCGAAVARYCHRFGRHAETVRGVLADVERAMQSVVTYGDIMRPPRSADRARRVLDGVRTALPGLAAALARIDGVGDDSVASQAALLTYTRTVLQGVVGAIDRQLSDGVPLPAGEIDPSRAMYDDALRMIERVDQRTKGLWGAVDLPILHQLYTMGRPFMPSE